MKIQDREQTNIIPSLVAIETILAHESTPRPSLFKLLLDEINFINTSQGMIFITIAVIQRDRFENTEYLYIYIYIYLSPLLFKSLISQFPSILKTCGTKI